MDTNHWGDAGAHVAHVGAARGHKLVVDKPFGKQALLIKQELL